MDINTTNNTAFCVLPFIAEFKNLDGNKYFCCMGKFKNNNINSKAKQISDIEKISNGIKIPFCQTCYENEENGLTSARIRETERWLNINDVKEYVTNWTPDKTKKFFYDIRYNNKCNLMCIMCQPRNSSLIAKEQNVVFNNTNTFNTDEVLKAKKVYIAGGEPFITEEAIELLDRISKEEVQPQVVINTNLSRISTRLKAILQNISYLTLTISVDSFGKVNEYHRYPLDWNKFIENLKWAQSIGCFLMFNTIIDAISIIGSSELCELASVLEIDHWSISLQRDNDEINVNNLPEHIKPSIVKDFSKFKESTFYNNDPSFKKSIDYILTELQMPGNATLLMNHIKAIDSRREINHRDYFSILETSLG